MQYLESLQLVLSLVYWGMRLTHVKICYVIYCMRRIKQFGMAAEGKACWNALKRYRTFFNYPPHGNRERHEKVPRLGHRHSTLPRLCRQHNAPFSAVEINVRHLTMLPNAYKLACPTYVECQDTRFKVGGSYQRY